MLSKMNTTTDKLRAAECEIKTLKSFLTSKTAIMERRKKELKEIKEHVMDLEDKDQKRTYILADVLEKTARLQDLTSTRQQTPAVRYAQDLLTVLLGCFPGHPVLPMILKKQMLLATLVKVTPLHPINTYAPCLCHNHFVVQQNQLIQRPVKRYIKNH